MKAPALEKFVLVVGVALAVIAGLSLLFCVALVGVALDKRNSVIQSVGYWPLFTLLLVLLSGCCFLGAEPLAKAIGKRKPDEHRPS